MKLHSLFTLLGLCMLLTGCLSSAYTVPSAELERLANTRPEDRGQSIRVVQNIGDDSNLEPHGRCNHVHSHGHPSPGPHLYLRTRATYPVRRSGVGYGTRRRVRRSSRGGGVRRRVVSGPDAQPSTGGGNTVQGPDAPGPRGGGGGGGGGGSALSGADIKDAKALAVLVVVGGVFLTGALIATEGMRYDGWVDVAPHHPLYLRRRNGEVEMIHLHELHPGHLRGLSDAVLLPGDGLGADFQGRAPLDRQGMTWKMEMGGVQLPGPTNDPESYLGATMQLGYFPHQKLGILGTLTLAGGTTGGAEVFGSHYGMEIQAFPVDLDPIHFGFYGGLGRAYEASAGGRFAARDSSRTAYSAGILGEMEFTTRFALSARLGAQWIQDPVGDSPTTFMSTLGIAVY